ncbi:hypothetical protein [Microcella sp.]|uniref:hypothetical protein n=1 Tax=Microcella sp. TaxID=1913979 RepID=UPI002567F598|nr:hypothetical protein [Microcella sp.]MBX9471748.1 hypothetical protein [Microcella sp.]
MIVERVPVVAALAPAEATLERLDPLSAAAARPVTIGAAILALAMPLVAVATRWSEVVAPAWLAVSLLALIAAVWLMLDRSRLSRPVWRAPSAQLLQLLLIVMIVTSMLSTLQANPVVRADWAPLVTGIVLIALTPYRPAREIALWAVVHTLICAMLGMMQAPWAVTDVPTLTYAVTGSLPVAALGFAAAAYARSLNGSIARWQQRAWAAAQETAAHQRGSVARSVQQQRITTLNREAVPYLSRVVDADELTDDDRAEARRLARSIRALLVADVERGWASTLLDDLVGRHPHLNIVARADDPDDLGGAATLEQRTLLRAIGELSIRRLAATELDLRLRSDEGRLQVQWLIATPKPTVDALRDLRGVIELVRGVTERSTADRREGRIALEFEYGF